MPVNAKDAKKLGKRIRDLRLKRGLLQEDVAEPLYTAAYISIIENGKRHPSHDALTHIASRLGVTVEQLVTGRDPDEDLRLEIEIQQAMARIHAGDPASARDALTDARGRAASSGHRRALLRAEEGLGLAFYRLGDHGAAREAYERADQIATEDGPDLRTTAQVGIARCDFQLGEVTDAIHRLESHLIDLRDTGAPDPSSMLSVFAALIPVYFERGLIRRAKEAAAAGSELASQVSDPEKLACLYINRAGLLVTQKQRRDALASLALADDLYRQLGWHSEIVKVSMAKAMVLTDDGRLEKAEDLLRKALDTPDGVSPTDRARALTLLASIVRTQGNTEEALTLAREATKVAGKIPAEAAQAHREAGWSEQAAGDGAAALKHWRRALKLFREGGNYEEAAKTSRVIGDHLADTGDLAAAAKVYREGLASLEELT